MTDLRKLARPPRKPQGLYWGVRFWDAAMLRGEGVTPAYARRLARWLESYAVWAEHRRGGGE